ncbi:unnamed protein product [Brassica rapa subsp. trilocularis]
MTQTKKMSEKEKRIQRRERQAGSSHVHEEIRLAQPTQSIQAHD